METKILKALETPRSLDEICHIIHGKIKGHHKSSLGRWLQYLESGGKVEFKDDKWQIIKYQQPMIAFCGVKEKSCEV